MTSCCLLAPILVAASVFLAAPGHAHQIRIWNCTDSSHKFEFYNASDIIHAVSFSVTLQARDNTSGHCTDKNRCVVCVNNQGKCLKTGRDALIFHTRENGIDAWRKGGPEGGSC